jgi:transcriptional regulatory protein LevR
MDIRIDESSIAEAINASVHDAVNAALKGYSVQSAIAQAMAHEITSGAIVQAIKESVAQVDHQQLVHALAREIQVTTTKAAIAILQESMVEAIAKLRGLSTYSEEDMREREMIRQRIFGREG